MGMTKTDLLERTFEYSGRVISLYGKSAHNEVGHVLGKQLLRSGTSIGANVHESQAAQSKADFISKISIAYKEAIETIYWLRLISVQQLIEENYLNELLDETSQLSKILSSILLSSKQTLTAKNLHS